MTAPCEKLHEFADGELPPEEVPAFELHLIACDTCQAELQDVMLLEALGQGMTPRLDTAPSRARADARGTRGRIARWVGGAGAAVLARLRRLSRRRQRRR
jgi:anti-sigma factor RsiW